MVRPMTQLKTEEEGTNEVAEIGRGGATHTNRVNYTLNRCRLIKNSGLHGGAVYVKQCESGHHRQYNQRQQ